MSHLNRFKLVYVQILVAISSSVAGEFIGLKDLKPEEIHALTWAFWTLTATNIVANAGNTVIALFQPKPETESPSVSTKTLAPADHPGV